MRRADSLRSSFLRTSPDRTAPVPLLFEIFNTPTKWWRVKFSHVLQPGIINGGNWAGRSGYGTAWSTFIAHAIGRWVWGPWNPGGLMPGSAYATFSPPPFDVVSLDGVPAEAFATYGGSAPG